MITPIRCGVDTLEATFSGELDSDTCEEFQRRKDRAQGTGVPESILLCTEEFFVNPKGAGFWSWLLKNDDITIMLGTAKNIPTMKVVLSAQGLASRGVDALWKRAREIGTELGLSPLNLSRIDVCVDFQGWEPTFDEMLHVICDSPYRPVFPNTLHPETFQYGRGEVLFRLYNKSKQIVVKNKLWWRRVWKLWGYDETLPVWRGEIQLRGPVLTRLQRRDVAEALTDIRALFLWGLDWCSLRLPTKDSNTRRWPEHPAWVELREAYSTEMRLGSLRPVVGIMEYDACVRRLVGIMASAGVSAGIDDFWELAKCMTTEAELLIEAEYEGGFAEVLEKKRKQKHL